MCYAEFSLKLIAAACALIIATDLFVLQTLIEKQDIIEMTTSPDLYDNCFKPQMRMRIIFTGYSINSAVVTLILTLGLIFCDEVSDSFDRLINYMADYMYIVFGPVLFTFCCFGIFNLPALERECLPNGIGNRVNFMDLIILLICTCLSLLILFIYAL